MFFEVWKQHGLKRVPKINLIETHRIIPDKNLFGESNLASNAFNVVIQVRGLSTRFTKRSRLTKHSSHHHAHDMNIEGDLAEAKVNDTAAFGHGMDLPKIMQINAMSPSTSMGTPDEHDVHDDERDIRLSQSHLKEHEGVDRDRANLGDTGAGITGGSTDHRDTEFDKAGSRKSRRETNSMFEGQN